MMESRVICSQCQHENLGSNAFCGKCGALLRGERRQNSAVAPSNAKDDFQQLAASTILAVKKEAQFIEISTLDEIHDKAIKWAKVQLFFLGSAVSILLMALFVWGYKQFSDFEQLILDSQKEIAVLNTQLTENAAQVGQDSQRVSEQAGMLEQDMQQEFEHLKQLGQEINAIDKKIHNEISNLRSELLESIHEAKSLQEQAKSDRFEIQKIQNSFYDVFFQIDDEHPLDEASQAVLFAQLTQNGFLIKDRNIVSHVRVNRSEVIYYNHEAKEKAQLLVDLLQKTIPAVTLRYLDRKERDARDILVKLRH